MVVNISMQELEEVIKRYKSSKRTLTTTEKEIINVCRKCKDHKKVSQGIKCDCELQKMLDKISEVIK